jgi:putative hemin transport protein
MSSSTPWRATSVRHVRTSQRLPARDSSEDTMHARQDAIIEAFSRMRRESGLRHREIAATLKISEGELIAAHCGIETENSDSDMRASRLRPEFPAIIAAMEALGEVMALTRNESCVHEKSGVYHKASHQGPVGLVLGGSIDLRLFYQQWRHAFAVQEHTSKGLQQSLQFFDASGTALHKIFLKPGSHASAYTSLLEQFRAEDQSGEILVEALRPAPVVLDDSEIDIAGFRRDWAAMRDTHEFFGLLKQYKLSRTQGLRLADPRFSVPVAPDVVTRLLLAAAAENVPIMVFVGNPGIIQIHSGPVSNIKVMGPWLNVLDEGFNLHLRQDLIANAWVVKKPTEDGIVTSLELFDAQGENIAMLFGERKPGKPELESWRALIADVTEACLA